MARRRPRYPSRDRGRRLLWWLALVVIGCIGGMFLGNMVVENRAEYMKSAGSSYARFSANPGAPNETAQPSLPCLDCPDSYGIAAQMRAAPDASMGGESPGFGAFHSSDAADSIDAHTPPASEPADDYRYGGRFPDPAPLAPEHRASANDPVQDATTDPAAPENPLP